METFPNSEQPEEGFSFAEHMHNRPLRDHETQGDVAWRLARWRQLQETGSMGPIGLSPEGEIKPYPNRLFVPPPLDESTPHPQADFMEDNGNVQ